jgi:hypothetical protein
MRFKNFKELYLFIIEKIQSKIPQVSIVESEDLKNQIFQRRAFSNQSDQYIKNRRGDVPQQRQILEDTDWGLSKRKYYDILRGLSADSSPQPFVNPSVDHAGVVNNLLIDYAIENKTDKISIVTSRLGENFFGKNKEELWSKGVVDRLQRYLEGGGCIEIILFDLDDFIYSSSKIDKFLLEENKKSSNLLKKRVSIFIPKKKYLNYRLQHFTVVGDIAFRAELTETQFEKKNSWELPGQGSFNDRIAGKALRKRFEQLTQPKFVQNIDRVQDVDREE